MSKVGVSLNIDVSKIDKEKLFKGKKGTYLDAQVFVDIDQVDQYGNNGMITQALKKGEKEQGIKGNILGNCKVFWTDYSQSPMPQKAIQEPVQQATPDFDDDIPF